MSRAKRPPKCRDCHEPIDFVVNAANGRRIPVDVGPNPQGSIVKIGRVDWDGSPFVEVFPNKELANMSGLDTPKLMPHRQTCAAKVGRQMQLTT